MVRDCDASPTYRAPSACRKAPTAPVGCAVWWDGIHGDPSRCEPGPDHGRRRRVRPDRRAHPRLRPGRARPGRARGRRRRAARAHRPRGGLHRRARRGAALPARLGLCGRHRAPSRRGQPLRRQRDGRPGELADDRPGCAGGPAGGVGPGVRPGVRRGGRPRRRQRGRRRPDPGRPGRHRGHRARRVHGVAGAALRCGGGRRRRAGGPAGLGGRRAGRARARLPVSPGPGRGLPPTRAAVRRRARWPRTPAPRR